MADPIDLDHLDRSVFGDRLLRSEVLGLFVDQIDAMLAAMAPSMGDDAWRACAHTLKGAARGVGAFRLGDLCAEAESLCGDDPAVRAERERVIVALQEEGARVASAARRLTA